MYTITLKDAAEAKVVELALLSELEYYHRAKCDGDELDDEAEASEAAIRNALQTLYQTYKSDSTMKRLYVDQTA